MKLGVAFALLAVTASQECERPYESLAERCASCSTCMFHSIPNTTGQGPCIQRWQYAMRSNASCCVVTDSRWWNATKCSFEKWAPNQAGFAGGCLSVASSLAVLTSYAAFPSWRQHPADLVWWMALTDLLYGCRFLFNALDFLNALPQQSRCMDWCEIFAVGTQFLFFSSEGWFLTISFDRLLVLRNPFVSLKSVRRWYHAFVWMYSTGLTALLYGSFRLGSGPYSSANNLCWMCDSSSHPGLSALKVYAFYVPLLLGQLFAIGTLAVVWNDLRQTSAISTRRRDALKNHQKIVVYGNIQWGIFLALKVGALSDSPRASSCGTMAHRTHSLIVHSRAAIPPHPICQHR